MPLGVNVRVLAEVFPFLDELLLFDVPYPQFVFVLPAFSKKSKPPPLVHSSKCVSWDHLSRDFIEDAKGS